MPSAARLSQDHRSARDLGHAARLRQAAALALAEQLEELWAHRIDYLDWINLGLEKLDTIGLLEPEWNDSTI